VLVMDSSSKLSRGDEAVSLREIIFYCELFLVVIGVAIACVAASSMSYRHLQRPSFGESS